MRRLGLAAVVVALLFVLSARLGVTEVRASGGPLQFGPPTEQLYELDDPPFGYPSHFVDVNNDGIPDLISVVYTNRLRVMLGRPQGGFGAYRTFGLGQLPGGSQSLHAADFDGDGLPDLAIGAQNPAPSESGFPVILLKNMGTGNFEHRATFNCDSSVIAMPQAVGDFNNDGRIDLLGVGGNFTYLILENLGDWQFRLRPSGSALVLGRFRTVADLDSDGNSDFVDFDDYPEELSVFYGDGGGGFQKGFSSPYRASFLDPPVLSDLDRNGGADLILPPSDEGPKLRGYFQSDDRSYTLREYAFDPNRIGRTIVGDLDLDGWPDLVSLTFEAKHYSEQPNDADYWTSLDVWRNNEGVGYSRTRLFTEYWGPIVKRGWYGDARLVDTNRDGRLDIVVLGQHGPMTVDTPTPGTTYNFIKVFPNTTLVERAFPSGPVAHWTGDQDATDSAGDHIDGAALGEVVYTQSVLGKGFGFTGAGGVVRLPDHSRINGADSFTVAGWVRALRYPTSRKTPAVVYMRGDDRAGMAPISVRLESDGRLWFRVNSHTENDGVSVPFLLNRWTQVVASYDSLMHKMQLFIDGRRVINHSTSVLPAIDLKLSKRPGSAIGNHPGAPDGPRYWPFFGVIDDVRFYAKPLSETEVKELFELAPPQIPAAPDGLKVTPISPSALRLTWRDQSFNETTFEIERQDGAQGFFRRGTVPGEVTLFDDTGLASDTTYTYRVRAVNEIGASGYSSSASGRTLLQPWPAPSNLDASSFNSRSVNLFWNDNTDDETGFSLERSLNGASFTLLRTLPANTVSYVDTAVQPVTRYWYRLRGVRGTVFSGYSDGVDITTLPNPPAAPERLSVEVRPNQALLLRWEDHSTNETKFRVEIRPNGGDWAEAIQLNANVVTWTATGLEPNRVYGLRVRAQNSGGFSAYTAIVNGLTVPVPVSNVAVTVPAAPAGRTQLEVKWSDPNFFPAMARLTRSKAGVVEKETVLNAGVRLFKDGGLSPQTAYRYTVYAQNASGEAAGVSKDATTLAEPPPPPNAPESLVATALSPTSAKLEWQDKSADETGFKIERATGTVAFTRVATVVANVVAWTDTHLAATTTYRYRVRTYRGTDHSAYSGEASVTTPTPPPPPPIAPASLTANATGTQKVALAWTDRSNNETKFHIEKAEGNAGAFAEIGTTAKDIRTYVDTAIAPASTYRYRVRASNEGGFSAYSNTASATIERLVRGELEVARVLDFGKVKAKKTKTLPLTLKNGSATERLSVSVGTTATPFKVTSGGGASVLEPGASRTVQVSYAPKRKKKKADQGTLTITSSDPEAATVEVSLTGKAK